MSKSVHSLLGSVVVLSKKYIYIYIISCDLPKHVACESLFTFSSGLLIPMAPPTIMSLLTSVPLQEFKHHGVKLQGPCASLSSAGCRGKFSSNVQRDILRKVVKHDPDQVQYYKFSIEITDVWGCVG